MVAADHRLIDHDALPPARREMWLRTSGRRSADHSKARGNDMTVRASHLKRGNQRRTLPDVTPMQCAVRVVREGTRIPDAGAEAAVGRRRRDVGWSRRRGICGRRRALASTAHQQWGHARGAWHYALRRIHGGVAAAAGVDGTRIVYRARGSGVPRVVADGGGGSLARRISGADTARLGCGRVGGTVAVVSRPDHVHSGRGDHRAGSRGDLRQSRTRVRGDDRGDVPGRGLPRLSRPCPGTRARWHLARRARRGSRIRQSVRTGS